ncbi:MAG: hypothetical protein QM635_06150 [Microbacteriaceae bacterium]
MQRLFGAVSWGALGLFVVVTVVVPTLTGSFLDTGALSATAPWATALRSVASGYTTITGDTVDSVYPQASTIVEALRQGDFAQWYPYIVGGTELGGLPNSGVYSPLSWPLWLLPGILAMGLVKLSEIAAITIGMSLFLRRWTLPSGAWALASLAFASSGFMVVWTNWPQSRVAALIPLLFWAMDLAATTRPAWRAIVPLALVETSLLLGGFPAVAAYATIVASAYGLVRAIGERGAARDVLAAAGAAVAGLLLGLGLAGALLVPFGVNAMTVIDFGVRAQNSSAHLDWSAVGSLLLPSLAESQPGSNVVESNGYAGVAVLLLALIAVLLHSGANRALVRFAVIALLLCLILVYIGGAPLALAQQFPLFSTNPIGRLRSVDGFLLAVLAAVGASALLAERPRRRLATLSPIALVGAAALLAFVLGGTAEALSSRLSSIDPADVALAGGCTIVAVAATALLLRASGRRRLAGAVALLLAVLVPATAFAGDWWRAAPASTFYPETAAHEYLAEHLGNDSIATVGITMLPGTNGEYRLRSVTGHGFQTTEWKQLLQWADPLSMLTSTYSTLSGANLATSYDSPILDRMGVRYLTVDPDADLLGVDDTVVSAEASTDGTLLVSGTGPVSGISLAMAAHAARTAGYTIVTTLEDADGDRLARTVTWDEELETGRTIAVDGDDLASGTAWTLTVRVEGVADAWPVTGEQPVTIATPQPGSTVDIVHTGDLTIYERTEALSRVRWADSAVVAYDGVNELLRMGTRATPATTVVLDSGETAADTDAGSSASIVEDDPQLDVEAFDVDASGAGYLVVMDSLRRPGWTATLDGEPVTIVDAEHAGGAVYVPAGRHRIELRFQTPGLAAGVVVSAASAAVLVALVALAIVRRNRGLSRPRSARHRRRASA